MDMNSLEALFAMAISILLLVIWKYDSMHDYTYLGDGELNLELAQLIGLTGALVGILFYIK